jgi:hypothetical protein
MSRKLLFGCIRRLPSVIRRPVTKLLHQKYTDQMTLSPEDFRDRRVLIVGPARTLCDDLAAVDVAGYDVIVKMNNGLDTPVTFPSGASLHCDVLFHSGTCKARPITEAKLRNAKVQVLVHRTPTKSGFLQTMMLHACFGHLVRVRHVDCPAYQQMGGLLGGASPTTGLMSACFFLSAPVKEVAIVGFTFFSTGYQKGYDDCVTSDADAICRIADKGHHKPVKEGVLLSRKIEDARNNGVTVTLGPHVLNAMQCCTEADHANTELTPA